MPFMKATTKMQSSPLNSNLLSLAEIIGIDREAESVDLALHFPQNRF